MRAIRGGSGLGDALYVQSIARHLAGKGETLEVCCDWPDVFRPLGERVTISPFRRDRIDILAHYTRRRAETRTDQFEDCCIEAGLKPESVEMRLDWIVQEKALTWRIPRHRPVIVVQLPRTPMDRKDGVGRDLSPQWPVIQTVLGLIGNAATIVQIGRGDALFRYDGIDIDLANRTSVSQMLDVASIADAFIGQCSFMVPLAESLGRPALFVWSRRGLQTGGWIGGLTPRKVLHADTSRHVVDDCDDATLRQSVDALLGQVADSPCLRGEDGGDRRERPRLAS